MAMAKNWIVRLKFSLLCFVLYVGYSLASDLNSASFVISHWLNVILFLGFLNNNTTVLHSCTAYAHSHAPGMKKRRKNSKQYITDNNTEIRYLRINQ